MARYKEPYTLYKRGKYWYFRTYDARGVRTSGVSTGKTSKTAARDFCEGLYLKGSLVSSRQTFKEFAEHFFDDTSVYIQERPNLSISSIKTYRAATKKLISSFGSCRLSDITASLIKEKRVVFLENYSIKYINTLLVVLSIILDKALEDDIIQKNPCATVSALVETKKQKSATSKEQLLSIYKAVPECMKQGILLLTLTGCRISEMLGIRSTDIIFEEGTYFIKLTKQIDNNGCYIPLKTKKERYIPIIPEIKNLFYTDDTRILYRRWCEYFQKTTIKLGLPEDITTHSIRHFFITQAKADGINPLIVETIAGHSLKGIEGVYTNFQKEHLTSILAWQQDLFAYLTQ